MSVKFQQETIRTSGAKPAEDLAHRVGERLTGGKTQTGYLAVGYANGNKSGLNLLLTSVAGLSEAAAVEPAAHEDDHFRFPVGCTRTTLIMDRPRYQQAWPLLQLARA